MWQEGQVVWAKLKWYPWWPAKVSDQESALKTARVQSNLMGYPRTYQLLIQVEWIEGNSLKVRVIFFEDNTFRDVNCKTLVDYTVGMKYKKTKRKVC